MLRKGLLALTLGVLGCSADLDDIIDESPTSGGGDAASGAGPSSGGAGPSSGGAGPSSGGAGPGGAGPGGAGPGGAGPGGAGPGGAGPGGAGGAGPFCGDGVVNAPAEQCDGMNLGGLDCEDVGFPLGGELGCDANCALDVSSCETGSCGNGTVEPNEACDDGNTDPNDGCSPGCQLQGATCASAIEIAVSAGNIDVSGNNEASQANVEPPMCTGGGTGDGREIFFRLVPNQAGILTLTLFAGDTEFDSVLYARQGCGDGQMQISCHDNYATENGNNGGELLSFPVQPNVPIIVVVDGYQAGDAGDFTLNIDLSSGDNCSDVVPIHLDGAIPPPITGTTQAPWMNDASPGAPCILASTGGLDMVYELTTPNNEPGSTVSVESTFDAVVYARSTCNGNQLTCDSGIIDDPEISLTLSSTPRYVWVDTESGMGGLFRLRADIDP